jgi:hemicentin
MEGVIRFNRVTGDEDGTYVCTAENIAGRVTAQAVLRIQGAPTLRILQSNPFRVRPNEQIRLECVAEGEPKPNVIWRKHQQPYTGFAQTIPVTEIEGKAILEIPSVSASDSGIYICTSTSPLGTTEERIQLIVEDDSAGIVVPDVVVEDRVVTVAAGNRAELRCFVRGTERDVELRWIRSGNLTLPTSSRVENGILYIDDVKPQDSGDYQCLGVVDGKTVLFQARARLAVVGKLIESAVIVILLSSLIIILLALLTARYLGKR